jgi:hypothetical protein
MQSLPELQASFLRVLRGEDPTALQSCIVPNGTEPSDRVAIYANNVRENVIATLEAEFPVVHGLSGRDWFRQTATGYLRAHPSRSGDRNRTGERFPEYLESLLVDGPYEYFADIARLEWAYQEVLVAADSPRLDFAALSRVPAEQQARIAFTLAPTVRLVESRYPVLAIWEAHRPDCLDLDREISLDSGPCRVLVERGRLQAIFRALPPGEFAFLRACSAGLSLVDAVAAAWDASTPGRPDFDPLEALPRLGGRGTIAAFHVLPPEPSPS